MASAQRKKLMRSASILALALAGTAWSLGAHADEWGCKVLLCMADPRGPRTEAECNPPIDRLEAHLRHGGSWPTCDEAKGQQQGDSWVQPVWDPYDPCPAGTRAAQRGAYVVQGTRVQGMPARWAGWASARDWTLSSEPAPSEATAPGSGERACVGTRLGEFWVGNQDSEGSQDQGYTVAVFDRVVWQARKNPRAADVYINGQWYERTRW